MVLTTRFRSNSNLFNVKDYGAKADGYTDDTEAIQDAIDDMSLATTKGGILYFPRGRYLLGPVTEWASLVVESGNLTIRGDGVGLSRLVQEDAQYPLIAIGADPNNIGSVLIEHLTFMAAEDLTDDGQDTDSQKGALLAAIGNEDAYIKALTVQNCEFEPAMRRCVFLQNIKRAHLHGCTFGAMAGKNHIVAAKPVLVSGSWHLFLNDNIFIDGDDEVVTQDNDYSFGSGGGAVTVHDGQSGGGASAPFSDIAEAQAGADQVALLTVLSDPNGNLAFFTYDATNNQDGIEGVDWFENASGKNYRRLTI